MVNKNQLLRRLMALGCLLLLCFGLAGAQLVQLQIVNGENYLHRSAEFLTTTSTVSAARGEILDRYGRPMVTNQTGFSLVLIYASFWEDKEDRFTKLLDLAHRVQADGSAAQGDASADDVDETADEEEILETAEGTEESGAGGAVLNDMLPITDTAPFAYVGESDDRTELSAYIKESASTLGLEELQQAKEAARAANEQDPQYDAEGNEIDQEAALDATEIVSASEFIDAMRAYLEENAYLPTGLSDEDVRLLVGLYYSMRQVSFSNTTTFTLADNVSMDLIAYIKEHHQDYEGVDVESKAVRSYDTDSAAHILGTVGSVDYEEWNGDKNGGPYREKAGYLMSDDIGKSGLEAALESYLHGTAGSRTVETDLGSGSVLEDENSNAPQPGDNVITTIDLELQQVAEDSMANYLSGYGRGGAAVALDPDTGEVLVMASYPTYDLENYNRDYDEISADSRRPELNRATGGLYPPGSTFKVLTAIAALEEGADRREHQLHLHGQIRIRRQHLRLQQPRYAHDHGCDHGHQIFVQHLFLQCRPAADRRAPRAVVRPLRSGQRDRHRDRRARRTRRRPDLPRGAAEDRPRPARMDGRRRRQRGDRPVGQRLYPPAAGQLHGGGRQRRHAVQAHAGAQHQDL